MTARCPTAASTSRTRARRGCACWAGRSWSTTTRESRWRRSAADSGSPVRARRPGHRGGHVPGRESTPGRTLGGAGDPVHRGVRRVVQHHPAERLRLLGDHQRAGPAGTRRGRRPRDPGPARGRRDRQGPAVQARRADAQDPRRRRGGRQRHRPHRLVRAAAGGRLRLLPGLGLVQHAVRRRLSVPRPAAADHRRRRRSRPRATGRASSTRGSRSSTPRPASRPRCACGSPGSARST